MTYYLHAVVFFHTRPSPLGVMLLVKPFSIVRLITMFITHQPTQSSEFRESSSGNGDNHAG